MGLSFCELARQMVPTEYEYCVHFEDGLKDSLRVLIALQKERDFTALVNKTKIAEEVKRAKCQNREKKRSLCGLWDTLSGLSMEADQMQATGIGTVQLSRGVRQPPRGRACNVSETLDILVERTASEVTLLSPLGQFVKVDKLFRNFPLEVQGVIFLVDLMQVPFGEFDLILGMDWLVKYRAILYCAAKQMVLRTVKENEVVVIGERRNYWSNVISTLKVEKLVRKGCEAYLAYISVPDSGVSTVKDIKTIKDFPDVFSDELPRLPPNWFSLVAIPLTKLLRKGVTFNWTDAQQESFEKLKKVLTNAPVLIQPDSEKEFTLYSDAFWQLFIGNRLVHLIPFYSSPFPPRGVHWLNIESSILLFGSLPNLFFPCAQLLFLVDLHRIASNLGYLRICRLHRLKQWK
ncbi:uncharacterized protein [Gossypium hirsutum]|uniref:Reverse transcriptase/retrotransposon-derived protein RNase H-like domain-containing protein n=1 Tax=Gossypium hirsutum TaxID=3635 RepID=A0ABM2ZWQ7_GOSHI|nr:uncharacterized protein LOC121215556 [Gossypium hirsutum]